MTAVRSLREATLSVVVPLIRLYKFFSLDLNYTEEAWAVILCPV